MDKEQLWPINDILSSLETECMIGVKLEKDGKISSEERRRRVAEAHTTAFNKLAPMTQQGDRQQQMKACKEIAPESMLHFIDHPWKALENALRNRNFENKRLCDKVACMEETLAALWEIVHKVAIGDVIDSDDFGHCYCVFCFGDHNFADPDNYKHEADCIVVKAQSLIAQNSQ